MQLSDKEHTWIVPEKVVLIQDMHRVPPEWKEESFGAVFLLDVHKNNRCSDRGAHPRQE